MGWFLYSIVSDGMLRDVIICSSKYAQFVYLFLLMVSVCMLLFGFVSHAAPKIPCPSVQCYHNEMPHA